MNNIQLPSTIMGMGSGATTGDTVLPQNWDYVRAQCALKVV